MATSKQFFGKCIPYYGKNEMEHNYKISSVFSTSS